MDAICCGASEPEASERSSSLIDAVGSQNVNFLASLWILVVRILYAQLFTKIPLHYHVCDGLCLNLTQLFIFVLIMTALTGLKIFIADTAANYCCYAV